MILKDCSFTIASFQNDSTNHSLGVFETKVACSKLATFFHLEENMACRDNRSKLVVDNESGSNIAYGFHLWIPQSHDNDGAEKITDWFLWKIAQVVSFFFCLGECGFGGSTDQVGIQTVATHTSDNSRPALSSGSDAIPAPSTGTARIFSGISRKARESWRSQTQCVKLEF